MNRWSCFYCGNLDKTKREPRSSAYYTYGCKANGNCVGWIEKESDLKNQGCSNFIEKGKDIEQLSLFEIII